MADINQCLLGARPCANSFTHSMQGFSKPPYEGV